MRTLLSSLVGCLLLARAALAADVQFDFYNGILVPQGLRGFYLYPEFLQAMNAKGLNTLDRIYRATGTNGSLVISNMAVGNWRGEFNGAFTVTTNWFQVTDTAPGVLLYATNLVHLAFIGSQFSNAGGDVRTDGTNILRGPNTFTQPISAPAGVWTKDNVKWWGAIGNETHDDTAAIQAAFDWVRNSGGHLFFPNGKYRVTQSLNLTTVDNENFGRNVVIEGESQEGAVVCGGESGRPIIDAAGQVHPLFKTLCVSNNNVNPSCGILIARLSNGDNGGTWSQFDRVSIYGGYTRACLLTCQSELISYRDCNFRDFGSTNVMAGVMNANLASNTIYGPIVSDYQTLTANTGANGFHSYDNCSFMIGGVDPIGACLVSDNSQSLTLNSCYMYAPFKTNYIALAGEACRGVNIFNLRQEYNNANTNFLPCGINQLGSNWTRNLNIMGGSLLPIHGDDGSFVYESKIMVDWNTPVGSTNIDLWGFFGADVQSSPEAGVNAQYRVRGSTPRRTMFWGSPAANMLGQARNVFTVPSLEADGSPANSAPLTIGLGGAPGIFAQSGAITFNSPAGVLFPNADFTTNMLGINPSGSTALMPWDFWGAVNFHAPAGNPLLSITSTGIVASVPVFGFGTGGGGGDVTAVGNNSFSGNNVHLGIETFQGGTVISNVSFYGPMTRDGTNFITGDSRLWSGMPTNGVVPIEANLAYKLDLSSNPAQAIVGLDAGLRPTVTSLTPDLIGAQAGSAALTNLVNGVGSLFNETTGGKLTIGSLDNLAATLTFNPFQTGLGTTYVWNLVGDGSGTTYSFEIRENASSYFHINSMVSGATAGYVGIGNQLPKAMLDVAGDMRASATITATNGFYFPQAANAAPSAGDIGGTVGSVTNHLMRNVAGRLTDYWSDGTTLWSKVLAP